MRSARPVASLVTDSGVPASRALWSRITLARAAASRAAALGGAAWAAVALGAAPSCSGASGADASRTALLPDGGPLTSSETGVAGRCAVTLARPETPGTEVTGRSGAVVGFGSGVGGRTAVFVTWGGSCPAAGPDLGAAIGCVSAGRRVSAGCWVSAGRCVSAGDGVAAAG
jgi:hypothetical protein